MSVPIVLAATSLRVDVGGIARVARLMARVLAEETAVGRVEARAVDFLDEGTLDSGLPAKFTHGSRARFVWEMHRAALRSRYFLYDSLSMARAHCRLQLLRRQCLVWIHGIEVWEMTNASRLRWSRRADLLVSNSAYTRERAQRLHAGFERAQVCWLGTETDGAPEIVPARDCAPTVLILGRMDEGSYKGHRELIDCWAQVVNAVAGARLLIVGRGPHEDEIRRRASVSPVAEHIIFRGFVPDHDMLKVWGETTVFAMPSRGEGFGLVYIEAMRHGRPVIASIHDAAPEVNLDGVTGYNVDLDKPAELPERLIHLLKNPDQATMLGLNGRQRWREQFTYTAFKMRFLPILTTFLNS